MDILADSPLNPASFLLDSMSPTHPPPKAGFCFLLPLWLVCLSMAMLGMAFFFSSYAPVRTGHLAKERPISWSFPPFSYSWILNFSGLDAYLLDIPDV